MYSCMFQGLNPFQKFTLHFIHKDEQPVVEGSCLLWTCSDSVVVVFINGTEYYYWPRLMVMRGKGRIRGEEVM